mmetsp:Transcript_28561/g.35323  ORF Transcript_28561/g.35323 Transcript_28561/m.35323 type:complete len:290 (-) Transcript_28561:299-1168(-)
MPDRLNVLLQLRGQLAKELVARIDLLLQVFFRASDRVEGFRAELMKVVFKADKVGLHLVKVVPVVLEVNLLLLGHLFAEADLAVGLLDLRADARVSLLLLLDRRLECLALRHVVYLNALLQRLIFQFKVLNFNSEVFDLHIGFVLAFAEHAIGQRQFKQVLIALDAHQTGCLHRLHPLLFVVLHGAGRRRLLTHWHWLHLLQHEVLVNLDQAFFLSEAIFGAGLRVHEAVTVYIVIGLKTLGEGVHAADLALQIRPQLLSRRVCAFQSTIDSLDLALGESAQTGDGLQL